MRASPFLSEWDKSTESADLHFDFNIAFSPAAAGQNFTLLNKRQRFGKPVNLTGHQTAAAGAAIAFPTLKLYRHVVRLKRHQ